MPKLRQDIHIEKGGPIANADYTLLNNTTPKEAYAQLDAILADQNIS